MSKKKPKYFLTYLCSRCMHDAHFDEFEKPFCWNCDKSDKLVLTKKEKHTRENINKAALELTKKIIRICEEKLQEGEFENEDEKNEIICTIAKHKRIKDATIRGVPIFEDLCERLENGR